LQSSAQGTQFEFGQSDSAPYNFAAGTDFAKYKTYKWINIKGAQYPNQILDQQIKQSIDSLLAAKGFSKLRDVGYQVSIVQETISSAGHRKESFNAMDPT
jgi:hypothetical protein